jgi:hypothetical protein
VRLKPGVTIEHAREEARAIAVRIAHHFVDSLRFEFESVIVVLYDENRTAVR